MTGIPPTHTLVFVGGDALKFKFQLLYKDLDTPEVPPVPRDLTGWSAFSQVRKTATSTDVEAEWEIDPLGSDGMINMYLSGPMTQPWTAIKTLVSDVQLTDPSGDPETVLTINLQVAQDVSRE
jgi:hypothetical protein